MTSRWQIIVSLALGTAVAACGVETPGQAAATEVDCEAAEVLALGERYETADGFTLTVHDVVASQSVDAAGVEQKGVAAELEICVAAGVEKSQFDVGYFRRCNMYRRGEQVTGGDTTSHPGIELRSPFLSQWVMLEDGACERGWLALLDIVEAEGQTETPVGVLFQDWEAEGEPRILWQLADSE